MRSSARRRSPIHRSAPIPRALNTVVGASPSGVSPSSTCPGVPLPRPPHRAVVFDLGGVAVRWSDEPTFRKVARHLGLPHRRVRAAMVAAEGPLERGVLSLAEYWDRVGRRLHRPIPPAVRRWWIEEFERHARPDPAVTRWLARLRNRGVVVACLSNTDASHVRILRRNGWLRPFSPALVSNELGALKPSRRVYVLARRRLGLPAPDIYLLDDRAVNVAGARRAGWTARRFRGLADARPHVERWLRRRTGTREGRDAR